MAELWRRCPKCGGNGMSPEGEWCDAAPHLHVVPVAAGALLIEDEREAVQAVWRAMEDPDSPLYGASLSAEEIKAVLRAAVGEKL